MQHNDDQPSWHPILAAVEREPGVWTMVAQYGREYGTIRIIRRGDEIGYRADDGAGELVGYYRTLRAACSAVHDWFLRSHTPGLYTAYWHDELDGTTKDPSQHRPLVSESDPTFHPTPGA